MMQIIAGFESLHGKPFIALLDVGPPVFSYVTSPLA